MNEYFTQLEASAKIDRTIQSLRDFSGVPKGTIGIVVESYSHTKKDCGISIQWSIPNRQYPLTDGFSKSEYEEFLVEI